MVPRPDFGEKPRVGQAAKPYQSGSQARGIRQRRTTSDATAGNAASCRPVPQRRMARALSIQEAMTMDDDAMHLTASPNPATRVIEPESDGAKTTAAFW